jgi:pyruvate/2-oxoglutarate dehydrogenase complex dihydrolipoamide acyltransferase (E2) component
MSLLKELRIPHMGSVENAKMLNWLLAEGGAFKAGQPLYEIETDKTVLEVEADADGVLARCDAREGDEMKVGDRVGYAAAPGCSPADVAAALSALAAEAKAPVPSQPADTAAAAEPSSASAEAGRISPLVRRLAAEHGVDLAGVKGTGPGGRIVGDDVLRAARAVAPAPASTAFPGYETVPVDARPNSARRRAIARRMAESARETAALTADMQVDLGAMLELRAARNAELTAQGKHTVSMLAYIAQALCRVLKNRPDFNATFTETDMLRWRQVNLGIAIDTEEGLVVPVIRSAEHLSLAEMETAIRTLAERARQGLLRPHELEGGTFTLSNPGSLGPVLRAEAVLNPPQVALLGLPAMLRVPVAVAGAEGRYEVTVRPVIRPSLTFDHRALDGGQAIAFLNDLRHLIEGASAETFR